ncbi:hypothetical protein N0V90_008334 [Kalmusia sp. IMI 367209]|nr:hypothetical protein N0V90_008334 [Kalmusia sp. IMI 367209]
MLSKTILLALAASAIVAAVPAPIADASAIADPEARWHSDFRKFPGQPISRREADAVADPEARWHSGFRKFPGQPISKREADAEPEALVNTEGKVLPPKKGGH